MQTIDLPLSGVYGTLRLVPWSGSEIREGGRYTFRLVGSDRTLASIEPRELFSAQPDDPNSGDFRPQQCVGDVRLLLTFVDGAEASATVEVLPTKLEYETEYREMLEQIADHAAEAVLQGFAPSSLEAHADTEGEATTRYRSLAFLAARFRDEAFLAAVERVRHQPHHDWQHHHDQRPVGSGLLATSSAARALQRGPSSGPSPEHLAHLPMPALPSTVGTPRTEATFDTTPNRFVRYVFSRWLGIALEVLEVLGAGSPTGAGPLGRGRKEAQWVADRCEEVLAAPALREAGRLTHVPSGNQVLLRRAGYREVLRAFVLAEASMSLDAVLPDDPFSATQRNAATLYEYWCFIALAGSLSAVAGVPPDGLLFEPTGSGLSLTLKQGRASKLSWELDVDGRVLTCELWFNRSFLRTTDHLAGAGSWARQLRPDASLRMRPKSARPSDAVDPELDVWLHFDAKYRIESLSLDDLGGQDDATLGVRRAKREDLLKMHAYRDAIRRSAGAYVLYPGNGAQDLRSEFHEVLPGLGAFPLRPAPGGIVAGGKSLEGFIRDVARQVANQASALERTQYWTGRYNARPDHRMRPVDFLERPPADTLTLVGYVRAGQRAWVHRTQRYNLRAGDRRGAVDIDDDVLAAGLVVLWTDERNGDPEVVGCFARVGGWEIASAEDLGSTGYPVKDPHHRYLVTSIEPLAAGVERLVDLAAVAPPADLPHGSPWSASWDELTSYSARPPVG